MPDQGFATSTIVRPPSARPAWPISEDSPVRVAAMASIVRHSTPALTSHGPPNALSQLCTIAIPTIPPSDAATTSAAASSRPGRPLSVRSTAVITLERTSGSTRELSTEPRGSSVSAGTTSSICGSGCLAAFRPASICGVAKERSIMPAKTGLAADAGRSFTPVAEATIAP